MHVVAPFRDFSAHDFIEKMKQGGLSPSDAMKVYDEIRFFGANAVRAEPVDPDLLEWDGLRLRFCERLAAIGSPASFKAYRRDIADLMMGAPMGKRIPPEKKAVLSNRWVASDVLLGKMDRSEMIGRLCGSFELGGPAKWSAWDEMGIEWEDVECAISKDIFVQPAPQSPPSPGTELALLEKSIREAGLAGVEWSPAAGEFKSFAASTTANIDQANHELCSRTGWQGGVLGLSGRVSLAFGCEAQNYSGRCCPHKIDGRSTIEMSSSSGWGVIAQEWLHALDFAVGNSAGTVYGMASEDKSGTAEKVRPWQTLMDELTGVRVDKKHASILLDEIKEGFKDRWTNKDIDPAVVVELEKIQQERAATPDIHDPGLRQDHLARLTRLFLLTSSNEESATLSAELAMADIELVEDREAVVARGDSVWIHFSDRFKDNLAKSNSPKKHDSMEWGEYFQRRHEQAARSFEVTFDNRGALIVDREPGKIYPQYPLPSEAMGHALVWRRFFKAASAWWESDRTARATLESSQQAQHDEPLPLAARFARRREAGATAGAASLAQSGSNLSHA